MNIFLTRVDYLRFQYYIRKYLSPDFEESKVSGTHIIKVTVSSVADDVELIAYCFMPNHVHLLCRNLTKMGISKLMRRLLTAYSHFYNKKYQRQGPLIQGSYRAVLVRNENQLTHTINYIHENPIKDGMVKNLKNYEFSSYKNYVSGKFPRWLSKPKEFKMKDSPKRIIL